MAKRSQIIKISMRTLIFLLLFASVAGDFGFDSANACSPNGKLSRRGRAQMLATIPCDLGKQAFCHLPGTAYPWHAVRRFVHENQGLMKRMYGDVRHISILRDEIQNNEIDIDDVESATDRYTKDSRQQQRAAKYMLHNRDDYLNYKAANNDVLMAPHFRPVTSTTTTTTTASTTTSTSASTTTTATPTTGDSPANIETTTTTTNGKLDIDGDDEDGLTQPTLAANEIPTLISFESIEDVVADDDDDSDEIDGGAELNSVYAPPAPPTPLNAQMGDNIEIIESPQLGLHNLSAAEQQPATISTTLKVATTAKSETPPPPPPPPSSSAAMPPRRVPIRRRPALQQQQQPTRKVNLTILKESSNSKSTQLQTPITKTKTTTTTTTITSTATKTNESERIPSTSVSSSASAASSSAEPTNAVKGVAVSDDANTTHSTKATTKTTAMISSSPSAAAATTTTALKTSSSTASLFRGYAHRNGTNDGSSNYYNYNYSHNNNRRHQFINAHMPSATTTTTAATTATKTTTTSATNAASSSSNASVLPLKANTDKLRKPVAIATPALSMNATAPAATTATPAAASPSANSAKPVLRDGQLYQDTMKQEQPPVLNTRGVNACPVKEEVVAPFWANNTRGEVLALLNLYPFEQYVHWEKCTHEHKQMYCRDGCRCEQQYRLHRLLAYDPHNECRGIFSDWFRFPSSCICKCYDIPMDFRATSRSPRADNSNFDDDGGMSYLHPIEVAEAQVKRAIYEHATEEWYRPRDEFDLE